MSEKLPEDTDLSHLFGVDVTFDAAKTHTSRIDCEKCGGSGKFRGRNGKVYGDCFTCNGSGLAHIAPIAKPGDCEKCNGTGEWRPGRPCFACDGKGRAPVARVAAAIDVSAIATAFAKAQSNMILRPKLRLADFVFSLAPLSGKNAGSIYVKRASDDQYLGKVTAGQFHAVRECDDATRAQVVEVAADPASAAKAYGLRFGICSVCARVLTAGESIDRGIGPICAEKFGW